MPKTMKKLVSYFKLINCVSVGNQTFGADLSTIKMSVPQPGWHVMASIKACRLYEDPLVSPVIHNHK